MKVRIDNKIYDSELVPIIIYLDEDDKKHIAELKSNIYCKYPSYMLRNQIELFINSPVQK